jgi:voltage-gated potassium channel
MQRHALAGSMVLVLSILLVFSTLMYFVEGDEQPVKLGSIPLALWWGMETLTTVGYGDVHPITHSCSNFQPNQNSPSCQYAF